MPQIKVIYKTLRQYWGWADHKNFTIEIYHRIRGKKKLEILLHESIHLYFPDKNEDDVKKAGAGIARMLWKEGCRFVDNTADEPLQDGKM